MPGFTLIEMLVVIAIIAVLASILFPVFGRARAKARQAACASNLKQIHLALQLYADDHDEMAPPVLQWVGEIGWYWQAQILPYARSRDIFRCPSIDADRTVVWCNDPDGHGCQEDQAVPSRFGCYYAVNSVGREPALSPGWVGNLSMNQGWGMFLGAVDDPSGTIWLIDAWCCYVTVDPDHAQMGEDPTMGHSWPRVNMRHNSGCNILFVDGHVKWTREITGAMWTRTAD
jgi:prepilin-type N-terminal cleavage/methylation domain-containing protein/prepilin-type processing-associated H-X9-DG protein